MIKHFYVFRHGQTENNLRKIWQGARFNPFLNVTGVQEAKDLSEKLFPLGLEVIYTSDLRRAKQTAQIVSEKCQIPVIIDGALLEIDFGEAEGKPYDELYKLYPEITPAVLHITPETWDKRFPGVKSESKHEAFIRIRNDLLKISQECKSSIIGISTHGGIMSALLVGLGSPETYVHNCGVAHITYDTQTDSLSFVEMV